MGGWEYPFALMLPWVLSEEHGLIFGWTGNPLFLPDGYVLCDGTNGTPDMRDRFVVGALDVYSVGEKNGVSIHVHSFTSDLHSHTRSAGPDLQAGPSIRQTPSANVDTGTTDPADGTPAFYAICFLMKL